MRGRRADADWQLTRRTDGKVHKTLKARDLWEKIGKPPGPAPIRACSSTPPSTNGTPAPLTGGSTPRTRAREYMFLDDTACNLASLNLLTFYDREATFDVEAVRACLPALDRRARDLGADGAVPLEGIAADVLRLPHARPWLRQSRHPADGAGPPVRFAPRAARCAAPSPRS